MWAVVVVYSSLQTLPPKELYDGNLTDVLGFFVTADAIALYQQASR